MEIGEYKCEVCPRKRTRKPKRRLVTSFFDAAIVVMETLEDGTIKEYEVTCPSCGRNLDVSYKFCPECGQALDWRESNGEDIRE